jgi:N-acetylmuramoyl-L-alanine amidase CwlA
MAAKMSRAEWRRRRRRKVIILRIIVFSIFALILAGIVFGLVSLFRTFFMHEKLGTLSSAGDVEVLNRMLEKSEYSRNGVRISERGIKGIVIHAVDNPGISAMEQRNYYNSLGTTRSNHLSSHFVVDLDGKIVQCIPVNEQALANGARNGDTLAIDFCYPDETGEPGMFTRSSLVKLTAVLVKRLGLTADGILRHSDITSVDGIDCPKFFQNEDEWRKFKEDVMAQVALLKK